MATRSSPQLELVEGASVRHSAELPASVRLVGQTRPPGREASPGRVALSGLRRGLAERRRPDPACLAVHVSPGAAVAVFVMLALLVVLGVLRDRS